MEGDIGFALVTWTFKALPVFIYLQFFPRLETV